MRGQTETLVFVILLLIGVSLFTAAVLWGRSVISRGIESATPGNAEQFLSLLEENIRSVERFGGLEKIHFGSIGTLEVISGDTVELRIESSADVPLEWVNTTTPSSTLSKRREGTEIVYRLVLKNLALPLSNPTTRIASPSQVLIEKKADSIQITFL